jgi:proteasome lid subunit RPN8/RPN11
MTRLSCPAPLIDETLEALRDAGRRGKERVVLWLAPRRLIEGPTIAEVYVPLQEACEDYFRIPPEGMTALMAHLRSRRLALLVQVHSHPGRAFHSRADDLWAVVRHEGGLSIVVPEFAAGISAANFTAKAAVFRLSSEDRWLEVPPADIARFLQVA